MKTLIQTYLMVFLLVVAKTGVQAQESISYGYDAAGNRIARVINMTPLRSAPENTEEKVQSSPLNEILDDFKIRIYPNPTKGLLAVEIAPLPEEPQSDIGIWNSQGQLIIRQKITLEKMSFDLSDQPSGIYFLKIYLKEQETVWKIIRND